MTCIYKALQNKRLQRKSLEAVEKIVCKSGQHHYMVMESYWPKIWLQGCIYLLLFVSRVNSQQTYPFVQLGTTLRNNSVVNLSFVGTADQLVCITDLNTCCTDGQGSAQGAWILPNGTRLTQSGVQEISAFTVVAGESSLALQVADLEARSNPALSGVYQCLIETSSGQTQSVFVGLYYEPDAGTVSVYFSSIL